MNSGEMFNWPDGDVILRSVHATGSRDFRVHKLFLSFSSPIFKDMFKCPQPSSPALNVDIIDVADPPQTLELVLRFIYPGPSPVVGDLTLLSEALTLADKYNIEVVRSGLRPSLVELSKTDPLRVYAIACRNGFEDEMKIASSHTLSINLPMLTQLPDEFKFIPATEYHRLIHLHARQRSAVLTIATESLPTASGFGFGSMADRAAMSWANQMKPIFDIIMKGTPLDYESLALALKKDYGIDVEADYTGNNVRSILDKLYALNLTI